MAAVFLVGATAAVAGAQANIAVWGPSAQMGGSGGDKPVSVTCSDGKQAIGISVNAGWYIHGIRLECAKSNVDDKFLDPEIHSTVIGSWAGGTAKHIRCKPGWAIVGFRGRGGWWLDRIEVACKHKGGSMDTDGFRQWVGSAGGTGGTAFGAISCPDPLSVFSIEGARGSHVLNDHVVWLKFSCRGRGDPFR